MIVIAAQAIRVAVLPTLARARERAAGSPASSPALRGARSWSLAAPVLVVELAADPLADAAHRGRVRGRAETAADALRWIVPAGVAHLFAGLAASGLAALDDYATAAFGLRGRERWPVWR